MAYNPATDFLGLLRSTSGGVRTARMPGLDFVLEAMIRAGLLSVSVGQVQPQTNQANIAWFQPAIPSWNGEGTLFLWNGSSYQVATPALWQLFLGAAGTGTKPFQSVATPSAVILSGTGLVAVQRAAPTATALILPNLAGQVRPLRIVDFSTAVTSHAITLTTPDGATIMQQSAWVLNSNAAQLAVATLFPSPDLNSWVLLS